MPKVYTPLTLLEHKKNPHLQPLKGLCCPAVLEGEVAQQLPELRNASASLLIHQLHPVDELCFDNVTMTRSEPLHGGEHWNGDSWKTAAARHAENVTRQKGRCTLQSWQSKNCLEIIAKLILFPGSLLVKQSVRIGRLLLWQWQVLFHGTGPWIQGTASKEQHKRCSCTCLYCSWRSQDILVEKEGPSSCFRSKSSYKTIKKHVVYFCYWRCVFHTERKEYVGCSSLSPSLICLLISILPSRAK